MKKTVVAMGVIFACLTGNALAAGEAGSWYAGAKAGWSDYYNADVGHKVSQDSNDQTQFNLGQDNGAGGVFLGYQANSWLALEGGYDYLGNMGISSNNSSGAKMENQGLQLGVKLNLGLTDHWDIYTRLGMMGWMAETKNADRSDTDTGISPLAALGTELAFNDDWAMRLEYQYVANIGEGGDSGITVDNGQTSLGLLYRFGGAEPVPVVAAPVPAPAPVLQPQSFNLQSDVLFAHDSATLIPAGHDAVVQLYQKLHAQGADKLHITVKGYTDSTGSDSYNQTLSTKRAQAVADVLMAEGVQVTDIEVIGMGESSPTTGNQCDGIKSRNELITCLAPDRRVVVEVSGQAHSASAETIQTGTEAHF